MKTIRSFFCVILVLAMLLPSAILIANAAEGGEIVNLYDVNRAGSGKASDDVYESFDEDDAFYTSGMIMVTEGDTITVGPLIETNDWFIRAYDKDGEAISEITCWDCAWDDELGKNTLIGTYTVPKDVKYIRVTTPYTFYDCTLITQNRPFTADEYFAEMKKAGVNVDFLRPIDVDGELVNLFPALSEDTLRGFVKSGVFDEDSYYRSRIYQVGVNKELQVGDVIYFAAAYKTHEHFISYVTEDGAAVNVGTLGLLFYEDLTRGYATYAYRVCPGTKEIAVNLGTGVYDDGIALVTKNQAFTGDRYRETFGIDLNENILDESSPLYGLKGLFIGDSISRGGHDYLSYLDHSSEIEYRLAWAGGLAAHTGLDSINASVSGARMSWHETTTAGHWIYDQMTPYFATGQEFDLVVMHGGVNDSPEGRHEIGTPLPVTATEEELEAALQDKVAGMTTFVSGLQWTIYNARKYFPNAELFFVANFQLLGNSRNERLGDLMVAAMAVCEMYGVHYIDLYNNAELTERLESDTLKNMDDTLHPNRPGYDIITPYIQIELERVLGSHGDADETTEATGDDTTAPESDGSDVLTDGAGNGADGEEGSGCGSVVSGTAAIVVLAAILPAAVAVKKKADEE